MVYPIPIFLHDRNANVLTQLCASLFTEALETGVATSETAPTAVTFIADVHERDSGEDDDLPINIAT